MAAEQTHPNNSLLPATSQKCNGSIKETETKMEPREKWSKKIQFLFGCCGFSVGLGNVWRFPYLCYRDGGGAFLIPYFICVFIGAIPMFIMEIALGQYTSQGAITAWNICPLFKGVGYATQVVTFLHNIYYQVILAWGFYYLFASFTKVLPWATCDNDWNTENCNQRAYNYGNHTNNGVTYGDNATNNFSDVLTSFNVNKSQKAVDPVTEYWQYNVLAISRGVDEVGSVKWDLALCLLLSWVIIYFSLFKGIKWTGKIMYVTVTLPYVFMVILLIRGATLPGAIEGIKYYLIPDFSKLANVRVWVGAATQVYFSYSMGVGSLTALGSFNEFHHNFWRDSLIFAFVNSGTSILSGFVIFSVLGFMAHEHQVGIDQVAESGPGLAFIAYPKAVAELPGAPVWSIFFFIMLLLLGMDSQFGCVEGFITAIMDCYPHILRRRYAREIFVGVICAVSFIIGLSMVTNGGIYVFLLFDYYCQARIIIVIAFFQMIAISWIYGAAKFQSNMELMLGRKMGPYMKYLWIFVTPAFNFTASVLCFYQYSDLTYNRTYVYPRWAVGLGWLMALSSFSMIPYVAVYKLCRTQGTFRERLRKLTEPKLPPPTQKIASSDKHTYSDCSQEVTMTMIKADHTAEEMSKV